MNFDKDLRNGLNFAAVLHQYSDNSARPLRLMNDPGLTEDDIKINMAALRDSMVELNLNYIPPSNVFCNLNNLQGMLLSAHLFLAMPYYLPKDSIEFKCILNETVVKRIQLSNQTQKRVSYAVSLEGSEDFSIPTDSIFVDPGQKADFPVSFYARISKPVSCRIIFKGNSEGAMQAAPIVYDLHSKVVGRKSVDRLEFSDVRMYDHAEKTINIRNPFTMDAEFTLSLEHLPSKRIARKKALSEANPNKVKLSLSEKFVLPSYYLPNTKIFIKAGKTAKVKFQYLPITYEVHICHLVILDVNVGELQYDIVGTPILPSPLQVFPIQTSLEHNKPYTLLMSLNYKAKLDAYMKVEELCRKETDIEFREYIAKYLKEEKDTENFKVEKASGDKDVSIPETFRMINLAKFHNEDEAFNLKVDQKDAN